MMTRNDHYHALVDTNQIGDTATPRGHIRYMANPGRGIIVTLLLDYTDLTQPKDRNTTSHAVALTAILPVEDYPLFEQIANRRIDQYGGHPKADLAATLDLLGLPSAAEVYRDDAVLADIEPTLDGTDLVDPLAQATMTQRLPEDDDTVQANPDWRKAVSIVKAEIGFDLPHATSPEQHAS